VRKRIHWRAICFAVSDGNPLFLVETLRDLVEAQHVVVADGAGASRHWTTRGVPRGARKAISDRLARLSPEAYALAEIAAVVGRGFGLELVTAVSGWTEGAVLAALDELLDRQILRDSSGRARAEYAFTHHLIQTAVYEGAAPEKIIGRHRRIAGFLNARAVTTSMMRQRRSRITASARRNRIAQPRSSAGQPGTRWRSAALRSRWRLRRGDSG